MVVFAERFEGIPLETIGSIDDHHRRKLQALSITTVEELYSTIQVDPEAMIQFMEGTDLPGLQAEIAFNAATAVQTVDAAEAETIDLEMAMGAEAPPDMEVEDEASEAIFDEIFEQFDQLLEKLEDDDGRVGVDRCDCFGAVRNQGSRGTCVGHAGAAVMECAHHRAYGETINFSPQFLFHSSKMADGAPATDGTWSRIAMPTLLNLGICEEAMWPYQANVIPGDVHHGPPAPGADNDALNHLAARIIQLDPKDSAEIRRHIREGRAVTISVPVYGNWYGAITKSYGKIPMPLPHSVLKGGHAMCACGFDFDEEFTGGGYFILRNSWGSGWASNSPIAPGYGAIPFEYIDRYGWEAFTLEL